MIEFGAHKLPPPPGATHEDRVRHARAMLARVLNMRTTVAVVGSGCTVPLGYPTWREFAAGFVSATTEGLRRRPKDEKIDREIARFEGFLTRLAAPEPPSSDSMMFYITACQRILETVKLDPNPYHEYIKSRFAPPPELPAGVENPCEILLSLPVSRFVTTNYDCEIERALKEVHGVEPWKLGLAPWPEGEKAKAGEECLSFTQDPLYSALHIRFALGRGSSNRYMVFHCHGRYDKPGTIIASEADYQRWYIADVEDASFAFSQTMNLLFRSNPLLFVGYGLREDDVLRPLRQLGAVNPHRKQSHPVFALLPAKNNEEAEHTSASLFERYGVHVIPYIEPEGGDTRRRGEALCTALRELKSFWDISRDEWVRKPALKPPSVTVRKPEPLLVPRFDEESLRQLGAIPVSDQVDDILDRLQGRQRPRVIGLLGSSGTGKTWNLLRLINRLRKERHDFQGIFYWNAYYSNEAITGLDLVLAYLDPERKYQGTREDRLQQCLATPALLIVDGCERLLRPGERPGEGRAFGSAFRTILKAIVDGTSQSTVILSGRLWPSELTALPAEREEEIFQVGLERARVENVSKCSPFDSLPRSDVSALVSLLGGHNHGLLLAARFLSSRQAADRPAQARDLQRRLAERAPQKRVGVMIDEVLGDLDRRTQGVGIEFLEHLSLFLEPIPKPTLRVCFARACQSTGIKAAQELYSKLLGEMIYAGLLVGTEATAGRPQAYAAHPIIREHLGQSEHTGRPCVLPDFSLSAYTAGTNGVDPGSKKRERRIDDLFESLHEEIESLLERRATGEARDLCRDAYGLLRSHIEAGSAARWRSYDAYMIPGIRLMRLIKKIAAPLWSFCEPTEIRSIESSDSPLYVGELAWIYNDVGLALFSEGLMQDAYAVWEQGYEINRVLEASDPYGEFVLESLLNLTHAWIEIGKIADASDSLEKAARLNIRLRDEEAEGRIFGYRGFLEHIGGNTQAADDLYMRCLERVRKTDNRRATSFFLTLQASLKLDMGDWEGAEDAIRSSRAAAEAGAHPDLVAYSRLPEAELLKRKGDLTQARRTYNTAHQAGHILRARALEALALIKLGEVSLEQGDAEGARRLALQSLDISNQLGLGLLSTRGLMVLARAMLRLGQRDLGINYLKIVKQRARGQQYTLRTREAERYLQEEGVADEDRLASR